MWVEEGVREGEGVREDKEYDHLTLVVCASHISQGVCIATVNHKPECLSFIPV